jgi:hypothetical protein
MAEWLFISCVLTGDIIEVLIPALFAFVIACVRLDSLVKLTLKWSGTLLGAIAL